MVWGKGSGHHTELKDPATWPLDIHSDPFPHAVFKDPLAKRPTFLLHVLHNQTSALTEDTQSSKKPQAFFSLEELQAFFNSLWQFLEVLASWQCLENPNTHPLSFISKQVTVQGQTYVCASFGIFVTLLCPRAWVSKLKCFISIYHIIVY